MRPQVASMSHLELETGKRSRHATRSSWHCSARQLAQGSRVSISDDSARARNELHCCERRVGSQSCDGWMTLPSHSSGMQQKQQSV